MPAKNGFQLQNSDIELLHFTHVLRLATVDQLAALSGRSIRALWGRLHKLKQRRYLAPVARFMQKQVYGLGSAGIPVLVEHGFAPHEFAEKRLRHRELTDVGIRHALFIADIHTRILLEAKRGMIALSGWAEGGSLWDTVPGRAGEEPIPVRPDAYFILKHPVRAEEKKSFHFFLEADRSTMSHQRMEAKIAGYVAYYERRLHVRRYPGMSSFLVATVTETRARAQELQKALHPLVPRAASRDAYLFIPFEDLTLASLLPKLAAKAA